MLDIISNDLWYEILEGLNMFQIIKLGHTTPELYTLCNTNIVWKKLYNKLFDRRIITQNAIHNGPVTWFNCRCTPYPGWTKIHDEINNSNIICRKIDHYINLDEKLLKRNYKSFKNQTKKRYIYLLENDNLLKNKHVLKYEKDKIENELKVLQRKLVHVNSQLDDCEQILSIIS